MELKQLEAEIWEHVSAFMFGQGFLGNLSDEDAEELLRNIMISQDTASQRDNQEGT